jgi:hypothetical protein
VGGAALSWRAVGQQPSVRHLGPGGAMDGAVDAAAAHQRLVKCVTMALSRSSVMLWWTVMRLAADMSQP